MDDRVSWDAFRERKVFSNLDGVRAISILVVIWHHTVGGVSGIPGTYLGFLGVDMFFVLSGFLIVTLVLRERERNGKISLRRFYMRRTLRIFPLYFAVVLLVGLISLVRRGGAFSLDEYLHALPYLLTYTSNWLDHDSSTTLAVAWSLAAEEQFYLVWPPIERFVATLAVPLLFVLLFYMELVNFEAVPMPFGLERAHYPMLQVTFAPILMGVLLAHVMHRRRGFGVVARLVGGRWSSVVLFGLLIAVGNVPNEDIGGIHRFTLQALMVGFLASVVVREDPAIGPLLTRKPMIRVGQISYGMYLLHMIVVVFALSALLRLGLGEAVTPWALLVVTLVGTYVASELSFRYFETPFLKLKTRFASGVDQHKP